MKKLIFLYILLFALLVGCASPALPRDTTVFCMDTAMNLRIYGDDGSAATELTELLTGLDKTLSVTDPDSALFALNQSGSTDDETVRALVSQVRALRERTGGVVDPSIYPIVRLWGFTTGDYRVPPQSEIDAALACVGMEKVSETGKTVTLSSGAALDFGAFAKGWAGELCRQKLEARGLSAILTLGGNIQTVGSKPDGKPWVIGVADPDDPASYVLTLRLQGSHAVVTSGDYQRGFTENGVYYCHIFDPVTGCPVQNGLRSVTVVCDSGFVADGLSTALFVMGFEKAVEFWRASNDFEAVFIDKNGDISVTEGLAGAASGADFHGIGR